MNTATKIKKFVDEPPKLELVPCYACEGLGYYQSRPSGELVLCECVKDLCKSCGSDESEKKLHKKYNAEINSIENCKCMSSILKFNRIKKLYEKANIPRKYRFAKVEDLTEEHDTTMSVFATKDAIRDYTKISPTLEIKQSLYLHGNTGSGKTHLACSILNAFTLKYGIETRYCKMSRDFIEKIRATYNKKDSWGDFDSDSEDKILKDLQSVPVLVLDDFGITKENEWSGKLIYDLLDTRVEANRPTIITSNKPIEDFKGFFENRIYSRLCETKQLFFEAADYRELHKETI